MTLDEVVKAVDIGDDTYLVGVTEHKTSTTYPAYIAFNGDQMQMMRDYMKYVRGEMPEDGTPDKSPFFRTQQGKHIKNFSQELNRLQLAYGILLKKTKGGSVTYTASHARRALEAASKVFYKGDNCRMKSVSDYLTHSQDVVLKHYARITYEEVKDARRAMDSLIRGQSSQGPAPANNNAAMVDDGAIPLTSTAAPTSKRAMVDDDTMTSTSTASLTSNRAMDDDGAMPSLSTSAPTSNRVLVDDDGIVPSTLTSAPVVDSDSLSLASEASLASGASSDTCVRNSGIEVEEAFLAAFPPYARTVPALNTVRKWLKATDFAAIDVAATSESEQRALAKRLHVFWRRQNETYELRTFLSVNNARPSTRDEAILLMKVLNLKNITHSRALMIIREAPPHMESRGQTGRTRAHVTDDDTPCADFASTVEGSIFAVASTS